MENVLPSPPTRTQTLCLQTQFSRVCNNSRLILKASSWCMKKIYFSPSYSVQVCVSGPICSSVGILKELLSLFQIIDSFVSLSKEFGSMQRVDVHILIKFDTEKIGGRKSYVIKINMIKVVYSWEVVVAQLAEQLLTIPEDPGSIPVSGNFYWTFIYC